MKQKGKIKRDELWKGRRKRKGREETKRRMRLKGKVCEKEC